MTGPEPRVANAPCSWGVLGGAGVAVGWERMLDELVAAGYHGTELGDPGFLPDDPKHLREALASRGLALLGGFRNAPLHDPDGVTAALPELLATAERMAAAAPTERAPYLILCDDPGRDPRRAERAGRVRRCDAMDPDTHRTFCAQTERVARAVRDRTGLATLFHPHAASRIETPDEIARFLDDTDPDAVGIVFDTAHVAFGHGPDDPEAREVPTLLRRFAPRAPYVHLKDLDPAVARRVRDGAIGYDAAVGAGLYPELGRGAIDFRAVLGVLADTGYDDWLTVEQDVLPAHGTPYASAVRNRAYLTRLGL